MSNIGGFWHGFIEQSMTAWKYSDTSSTFRDFIDVTTNYQMYGLRINMGTCTSYINQGR